MISVVGKPSHSYFPNVQKGVGLITNTYLHFCSRLWLRVHLVVLSSFFSFFAFAKPISIEVAAPLLLIHPDNPGWDTSPVWDGLALQIKEAKALGADSMMVDVWWGLVQRNGTSTFDWSYYKKIFSVIRGAGLKVSPILSFHACGPNHHDTVQIPLPPDVVTLLKIGDPENTLAYLSEAGNYCKEVVSIWGVYYVLPKMAAFVESFSREFAADANSFQRIYVGTGPAGEAIVPSYHSHDRSQGYGPSQIPGRGSLQISSGLAQKSLRKFLAFRYGKIQKLNQLWKTNYGAFSDIQILRTFDQAEAFARSDRLFGPVGVDVFDWLLESNALNVNQLLSMVANVTHKPSSPFATIPISFKLPGVHWDWDASRRFPQMAAGLISPRSALDLEWSVEEGEGYRTFLAATLGRLRRTLPHVPWELTYTAGELPDVYDQRSQMLSGGETLVKAVSQLMKEEVFGFPLVVENALPELIYQTDPMRRLFNHVRASPQMNTIAYLRIGDFLGSSIARKTKEILEKDRRIEPPKPKLPAVIQVPPVDVLGNGHARYEDSCANHVAGVETKAAIQ